MNTTSFKNFVPKLFQSAEQQEQIALEKIERQRQEREREKGIATRFAILTDGVDAARDNYARQCRTLDEIPDFSPADFAEHFLSGRKIEDLAIRLVAVEKLKASLPQIKVELQKIIVGAAEKSLADFQKANRDVLGKLPKLERAAEPVFIAAELPKDHYESGASAKLTSRATGIVK